MAQQRERRELELEEGARTGGASADAAMEEREGQGHAGARTAHAEELRSCGKQWEDTARKMGRGHGEVEAG